MTDATTRRKTADDESGRPAGDCGPGAGADAGEGSAPAAAAEQAGDESVDSALERLRVAAVEHEPDQGRTPRRAS